MAYSVFKMCNVVAAFLTVVFVASCSKPQLTAVWTEPGFPPETLEAPHGFEITPLAAFMQVQESRCLSSKHDWACYRDDERYYIYDTFITGISASAAQRHGIRINGKTGEVEGPALN